MKHTVLITTSGVGERLGELTKYTNKALVRVGTKPAISHIIESYPADADFVITVGAFGQQVRDFISLAYPQLSVTYVSVDPYQGEGSSLGYSMLQAEKELQRPFIYHACDTLVEGHIPVADKNWIGVIEGKDTSQYASWTVQDNKLLFHDKGATDADYIHIGLVGIHDYKNYWTTLRELYEADPLNSGLNDCQTIAHMIIEGTAVEIFEVDSWYDIGNVSALQRARERMGVSADDLDKFGEAVFLFDTHVIKFFADAELVRRRAERAIVLKEFVPKLEGVAGNFYRYTFVEGDLYSHVVQPHDFAHFLKWAESSFWITEEEVDETTFKKVCLEFYRDKTDARITTFLKANGMEDMPHTINGEKIPPLKELLSRVDFEALSETPQYRFHGDFILENILKTEKGYCLIDWRQDFGGLVRSGDRYYDLAKLNHNLVVNHRMINLDNYTVESGPEGVRVDILRPQVLVECQRELFDFLRQGNYDTSKVETITALIWLNMAPLHHHPFSLFLYYFGKLNLWHALQKN